MDNILLKVSYGEMYSFFNSKDLNAFTAGTKGSTIKLKGDGAEAKHIEFYFEKGWYARDISEQKNVKYNRKLMLDKAIKIKEGDVLGIYPSLSEKKILPSVKIEVIKNINIKKRPKGSLFSLTTKNEYFIGSGAGCDLVVESALVNPRHARIVYDGADCYVEDLRSLNGTYVNNRKIKRAKLANYDRISMAGAAFIFYDFQLLSSTTQNGIEISAVNVERVVYDKKARREINLVDHISMTINAGEFVAVVGGSGTGKSTFVDCLNGLRPCTAGKILFDGNEYYENINTYRGVVGIVPQADIMHDDLPLFHALCYTASLRMRTNLTKDEIVFKVEEVIKDVHLQGKEHLKISALSGGQRKRVSIAMELLADPKVIFLDEPTSGLSPDLDYELMELLKELAAKGRTIVIITHSMENIELCDRIAMIGKGGKLCFYGPYKEINKFFGTSSFSKIFAQLSDDVRAEKYRTKYDNTFGVKAAEEDG